MPALLDSPPQLPSMCGWGMLYPVVEETVKPRHFLAVPAAPAGAAKKQPAYSGGRKKNLETCTEALGCETGGVDVCVEVETVERKRRSRDEVVVEEEMVSACQSRRPLPPPLTTLARGVNRVRMVHERRDGRLEVRAVRSPSGVLEAERADGRLRLRLLPLRGAGSDADAAECRRQEPGADEEEEAKEAEHEEGEEEYGFFKYVRGGRCAEPEGGAVVTAARLGKQWEPEQAAAFWVATS